MNKVIITLMIFLTTSFLYSQSREIGLVAYYPFNGNANDESGNGNNGTVFGATLTTDRFNNPNKAYSFDGINNYINCSHSSSLRLPAVSISMWYYAISDPEGRYLMCKADSYEYSICWDYSDSSNGLKSDIGGGAIADEIGTNFFPINYTWYHVVVTWQYPGNIKIFHNGTFLKSQFSTHTMIPTSEDLVIGFRLGSPSYRYFDGKIDDIRIYNYVISDSVIQALFHEGGYTLVNINQNKLPDDYKLHQNYPNPFNPVTNIKFDIPKTTFVTLKVFDLPGREVTTLVNEKLNPGSYQVDWNANLLSSGVYFYRLQSDSYIETKKMILVK